MSHSYLQKKTKIKMETPEDIWGNLEIPIDPLPDFDPAFQPLQYRVFQLFLFYLENFIMKMPINVQDLELQILKNKVQNQLRNLVFPLEEMALESITVNEMPYCAINLYKVFLNCLSENVLLLEENIMQRKIDLEIFR